MPRTASVQKEGEVALAPLPPQDRGISEPEPAEAATKAVGIPPGWFAVDSEDTPAPDNGRQIWLSDGAGNVVEGFWRHSRRRARSNGLWEQYAYWALCNGAGAAVPFTPKMWRPSNALVAQ